jgi:hypothetical protein
MTVTPVIPRTICSRLVWAVTDAWVITRRDLAHSARQPGAVIASTLLFPVMIVLMFGYLLGAWPLLLIAVFFPQAEAGTVPAVPQVRVAARCISRSRTASIEIGGRTGRPRDHRRHSDARNDR